MKQAKREVLEAVTKLNERRKLATGHIDSHTLSHILKHLLPPPKSEVGIPVFQRGAKKATGVTTGSTMRCRLEGCPGIRICVRWKNGRRTWPCSRGMRLSKKGWRIL